MKAFNRLLAAVIIVSVIILLAVNVYVLNIRSLPEELNGQKP